MIAYEQAVLMFSNFYQLHLSYSYNQISELNNLIGYKSRSKFQEPKYETERPFQTLRSTLKRNVWKLLV